MDGYSHISLSPALVIWEAEVEKTASKNTSKHKWELAGALGCQNYSKLHPHWERSQSTAQLNCMAGACRSNLTVSPHILNSRLRSWVQVGALCWWPFSSVIFNSFFSLLLCLESHGMNTVISVQPYISLTLGINLIRKVILYIGTRMLIQQTANCRGALGLFSDHSTSKLGLLKRVKQTWTGTDMSVKPLLGCSCSASTRAVVQMNACTRAKSFCRDIALFHVVSPSTEWEQW